MTLGLARWLSWTRKIATIIIIVIDYIKEAT